MRDLPFLSPDLQAKFEGPSDATWRDAVISGQAFINLRIPAGYEWFKDLALSWQYQYDDWNIAYGHAAAAYDKATDDTSRYYIVKNVLATFPTEILPAIFLEFAVPMYLLFGEDHEHAFTTRNLLQLLVRQHDPRLIPVLTKLIEDLKLDSSSSVVPVFVGGFLFEAAQKNFFDHLKDQLQKHPYLLNTLAAWSVSYIILKKAKVELTDFTDYSEATINATLHHLQVEPNSFDYKLGRDIILSPAVARVVGLAHRLAARCGSPYINEYYLMWAMLYRRTFPSLNERVSTKFSTDWVVDIPSEGRLTFVAELLQSWIRSAEKGELEQSDLLEFLSLQYGAFPKWLNSP